MTKLPILIGLFVRLLNRQNAHVIIGKIKSHNLGNAVDWMYRDYQLFILNEGKNIMFSFPKWVEVYFSNDTTEYFRIQNVLRENAIRFKTKTDSGRDRMSMDVITGGNPAAINNVGLSNNYRISVKEDDEYRARELIDKRN